jgi:hypothetical protein
VTSSKHADCELVPQLVTTNSDTSGLLAKDLGVEPTWWEDLSDYEKLDDLTECGDWSPTSDADEFDYEDDEDEVEHYGSEVEDDDVLPHILRVKDDSDGEQHEEGDA